MKLWTFPVVALAVLSGSYGGEPSERQMRTAFEMKLVAQVRATLDYLAETRQQEVLAQVRDAGTDRFSIGGFRKIVCEPIGGGHRCRFVVDVLAGSGTITQELEGVFAGTGDGVTYQGQV